MNKQDTLKEIETIRARLAVLENIVQEVEKPQGLWRPSLRQQYWFIGIYGDTCPAYWVDDAPDNRRLEYGNCFAARGAAEKAAQLFTRAHKIIQAALQVDPDAGGHNAGERNWTVYFNVDDMKWKPDRWGFAYTGLPFVHTEEQAERMAAILNAEGVV